MGAVVEENAAVGTEAMFQVDHLELGRVRMADLRDLVIVVNSLRDKMISR